MEEDEEEEGEEGEGEDRSSEEEEGGPGRRESSSVRPPSNKSSKSSTRETSEGGGDPRGARVSGSTWGAQAGAGPWDWPMRRGPEVEGPGPPGGPEAGSTGALEAPQPVCEPRWIRWLTMMLLPKPPMDAMVVLCSRCTTAVMPPSAISRRIRARASSPDTESGDTPGPMRGRGRSHHTHNTSNK